MKMMTMINSQKCFNGKPMHASDQGLMMHTNILSIT